MKIKPRPMMERQGLPRTSGRLAQLNKAARRMRRYFPMSEMIAAAIASDNRNAQLGSERGSA